MSSRVLVPIVSVSFLYLLLTGCTPPAILYVPGSVLNPPLREVLEDSLQPTAGGRRMAALRSTEEFPGDADTASPGSFIICTSDGRRCATLSFGTTGIERSIEEAVRYLLDDVHMERVVVAVDEERRHVADRLRTGPLARVRIRSDRDTTNFIESLSGEVAPSEVGVILLLGRDNEAILRGMGVTGASRRVVAEFLLPAGGDRLAAAGYPIAGVISYPWSEVVDRFLRGDSEGDRINVPMQFFRY